MNKIFYLFFAGLVSMSMMGMESLKDDEFDTCEIKNAANDAIRSTENYLKSLNQNKKINEIHKTQNEAVSHQIKASLFQLFLDPKVTGNRAAQERFAMEQESERLRGDGTFGGLAKKFRVQVENDAIQVASSLLINNIVTMVHDVFNKDKIEMVRKMQVKNELHKKLAIGASNATKKAENIIKRIKGINDVADENDKDLIATKNMLKQHVPSSIQYELELYNTQCQLDAQEINGIMQQIAVDELKARHAKKKQTITKQVEKKKQSPDINQNSHNDVDLNFDGLEDFDVTINEVEKKEPEIPITPVENINNAENPENPTGEKAEVKE